MTLTVFVIIYVLLVHWLCDFGLQSEWQAKNKSHSIWALLDHVFEYSLALGFSIYIFSSSAKIWFEFVLVNFVVHLITDFFTSKINAYLWKKGNMHNFFVSVGADQFIHQLTLILTVVYILNLGAYSL